MPVWNQEGTEFQFVKGTLTLTWPLCYHLCRTVARRIGPSTWSSFNQDAENLGSRGHELVCYPGSTLDAMAPTMSPLFPWLGVAGACLDVLSWGAGDRIRPCILILFSFPSHSTMSNRLVTLGCYTASHRNLGYRNSRKGFPCLGEWSLLIKGPP